MWKWSGADRVRSGLVGASALVGILLGGAANLHASLLVMSQDGNQVLEYDDSFVGVFADTVSEGFRNPVALAPRSADGKFYLPSASSGELWSYTSATAAVITPALATGLFSPTGAAFDAAEAFLYFADQADVESELVDSLYRYEVATGNVTLIGTQLTADFQGVAVNGSDVFATDVDLNRVIRFPTSGGSGTAVISIGLSSPTALLFSSATVMLIADTGSDRVLEYVLSAGNWVFNREVVPASAGLDDPCGLDLAPDGRLTVGGRASNDAVLVDLVTLAVTPLVAPGAGGLAGAVGLAWDENTLLVASASGNAVVYYDDTGDPTGLRAEGVGPPLEAGIAFWPDGSRLLVATSSGDAVLEYDVETGALLRSFVDACPTFPGIFDVVIGPDGNVYVSCTFAGSVYRFDGTAGASLGLFIGGHALARGLDFGPNGNLFVSKGSSGEIIEYHGTTGALVGVFVDGGGNGGGPVDPWGLLFHDGALYVASRFPNEVRAFDATTGAYLSTFVTSGSGGLVDPTSLAFGPDGDLYVTSRGDDAIRRYAGSNGAFVEVFVAAGSGGLDAPFDLAFEPTTAAAPFVPGVAPLLLVAALAGAGAWTLRRAQRVGRGESV